MKVGCLEGCQINSEADFHAAIAKELDFSGYYGRNLNALWDVMTVDVERPVLLLWKSARDSRLAMGESFETIVELLRRVERQDVAWGLEDKFQLRLEE